MPGFVRDSAIINITYAGEPITGFTGAATYNSDAINVGTFIEGIAFINSTAHGGTTPTLDCKMQYSPDYNPQTGIGTWIDSGDAFAQITTTDSLTMKKLTANFGKWIRFVFTVGGTNPTYTCKPYVALKA